MIIVPMHILWRYLFHSPIYCILNSLPNILMTIINKNCNFAKFKDASPNCFIHCAPSTTWQPSSGIINKSISMIHPWHLNMTPLHEPPTCIVSPLAICTEYSEESCIFECNFFDSSVFMKLYVDPESIRTVMGLPLIRPCTHMVYSVGMLHMALRVIT